MEPFGEVRDDLRMANMIKFYYDSRRGKKGKAVTLGSFSLYDDLMAEPEPASEAALIRALGS